MFRFKDSILPLNKTLPNSLKKIYGIGYQRGFYISNMFGFSNYFSVNLLNYYFFECMVSVMKQGYILEDRLKFNIKNRFLMFREIGLIKVKRYDQGLPMRGQRTHTNGETPRRNRIF
jgi:small subunit ribosomal protein S13